MQISKIIKKPFVSLILHYLAWELLYGLTYLPILISNKNPDVRPLLWENFRYNNGLLGSVNFVLFALMAFIIIPLFFIKKRKWTFLIISCIAAATLFTFIKYKLDIWHNVILTEKVKKINQELSVDKLQPGIKPSTFKPDSLKPGELTDTSKKRIQSGKPVSPVSRGSYGTPGRYLSFKAYLFTNIWYNIVIIFFAFGYMLLRQWFLHERIRRQLESQKLKAELSFLKLQVNPHFLFNALNNIYSLAVMEKGKRTGDSIMKLSDLIRYMLYEKEDEEYKVSLDKEINHINSFIDLQRLRHVGDIYIQFSIEGEITGKKIPPLLLFPLIENSCKHGILQDMEKPVTIQIKIADGKLYFSIHNFKNDYLKDNTGGIGLENVRKRLALLFPNRHTLNIKETEEEFIVELQLPL
jgi:two-component system, LytTR family, sensor kinase